MGSPAITPSSESDTDLGHGSLVADLADRGDAIGSTAEVTPGVRRLRLALLALPLVLAAAALPALGWAVSLRAQASTPPRAVAPAPAVGDLAAPQDPPSPVRQTTAGGLVALGSTGEPVTITLPLSEEDTVGLQPGPAVGSVDLDGTEAVYTPGPGFVGTEHFTLHTCTEARCRTTAVAVTVGPPPTARLVVDAAERVLDTRSGPASASTAWPLEVTGPPTQTAVALSVSLIGTQQSGQLAIRSGATTVAIDAAAAGVTTSALVVVPTSRDEPVQATTTAGGDVVIDVVGRFHHATTSSDGRIVAVEPTVVGNLVTADDGRELIIDPQGAGVPTGAVAVLATIRADVGADGGVVRLGPTPRGLDQMLMWSAADPGLAPGEDVRSGTVLLPLGPDGTAALRYEGGFELSVDVQGYVTGPDAVASSAGLIDVTADGPWVLSPDR